MNNKHELKKLCAVTAISIIAKYCYEHESKGKVVKPKRRRIWSREWLLQRHNGKNLFDTAIVELKLQDPTDFQNFCRLSKEDFENLLCIVGPHIQKQNTILRESISASTRLLITLRFLASGSKYKDMSFGFHVSPSSISQIIPETVKAIYNALSKKYLNGCRTALEWKRVAESFYQKRNFPMCLGAIDGKHISFKAKSKHGSNYSNYKGFNSIILMAVVDANNKFIMVDVGTNGTANDIEAFNCSEIGDCIKLNLLNFPEDEDLPGTSSKVPYVFLSDEAFCSSSRILKPYEHENNHENKIFNYRLSRAQRVAENGFRTLSNRFQIFQREINLSVEKVQNVILACCALHNFLSKEDDSLCDKFNLTNLQISNDNKNSNEGCKIRDHFKHFFNNLDILPWQEDAIKKSNFQIN